MGYLPMPPPTALSTPRKLPSCSGAKHTRPTARWNSATNFVKEPKTEDSSKQKYEETVQEAGDDPQDVCSDDDDS